MTRKAISEVVKRKLYAESIGKCMNPSCQIDLFLNGDKAEKAHIIPHCDTADNSFENLILICPNCHTDFDKNEAFTTEEVKNWKKIRQEEINTIFSKKYENFEKLEEVVKPLLEENKAIYENYYLGDNPKLWKKSEETILTNNQKLKLLLHKNRDLFQKHSKDTYSNLAIIDKLIIHINEFDLTREDDEKIRSVLFPEEVNSIFGVEAIDMSLFPSSESLECLINSLKQNDYFINITIFDKSSFIEFNNNGTNEILYLNDAPRLRQMYDKYNCFRKVGLRLESLIYVLTWLSKNDIQYKFPNLPSLSDIEIKGKIFKFVYEYCLSKETVISLSPKRNTVIFNLFNFNGGCISNEAYEQAEMMEVELLLHGNFYKYVHRL